MFGGRSGGGLLGSTGRSDEDLSVLGCAVAFFQGGADGTVSAAYHSRVPGKGGSKLTSLIGSLLSSKAFRESLLVKSVLTVDDSSLGTPAAVHCRVFSDGLVLIVVTHRDYPTRVVFEDVEAGGGGLLGAVYRVATDCIGLSAMQDAARHYVARPATSGAAPPRTVELAPGVVTAFERACADYEDVGAHDSISRVQAQVDDARGAMSANIRSMLENQEQLTNLQGKTDQMAAVSKGFYKSARTTRTSIQWQELRVKLVLGGVGLLVFLWIFGPMIFGSKEEEEPAQIPS
jgi:hypothetical protein